MNDRFFDEWYFVDLYDSSLAKFSKKALLNLKDMIRIILWVSWVFESHYKLVVCFRYNKYVFVSSTTFFTQEMYEKRQINTMMSRVVDGIIAGVKTPVRPSTPFDDYLTVIIDSFSIKLLHYLNSMLVLLKTVIYFWL